MSLACTITDETVSILLDGRMRVLDKSHANFSAVIKLLKKINNASAGKSIFAGDPKKRVEKLTNKLRDLIDIPQFIEKATAGRVTVTDKGVLFNGAPIHNTVAKQIMRLLNAGHDVTPLANFLDKVMDNPNGEIAEELYQWIESSKHISFAPDGDFFAYKKVAGDYSSIHPGPNGEKVYNRLGTTVSEPREVVDADRNRTCSRGLHFCSFDYLDRYGHGGEERVVITKINPADVVAIPTDYNYTKGRACKYDIVAEVPEDELSPDIFAPAVLEASDDFRLSDAALPMYLDFGQFADDDDVEDLVFNDDHWSSVEDESPVDDAMATHESPPPRTIPVVDKNGVIIRYIEE